MENALLQAFIYLAAAVVAVPLARALGLGSVLGYLAAGIAIGPIFGFVGSEAETLQTFAEFGVVMMLFIIGLELDPARLWQMRAKLLGLGGLQMVLTAVVIALLAVFAGESWPRALAIGLILGPSSTAIVLQTLTERGLIRTPGGEASFSVLLFQDVSIIPILALLPLLAAAGAIGHGGEEAHHNMSILADLPTWAAPIATLGAVVAVVVMGRYLTRPIFRYLAMAQLREIFTAAALLLVIATAILMGMVGLSPALGTFLAGVVLANSEYRHELEADLEPFKGLLLGLFFTTVGAGVDLKLLASDTATILGLAAVVLLAKIAVLALVARIFGLRGTAFWLFALGLGQAGEFAFVLLSVARAEAVLPTALSDRLSLVVALTMLATPMLFLFYEHMIRRRFERASTAREPDEVDEQGDVIIAGQGRFGQIINRILLSQGHRTVVLDHRYDVIEGMRKLGYKTFFGDPSRPDLLRAAGLPTARVLVVAIDDSVKAVELVRTARAERPDLHIVARARDRFNVYELFQAGADDIIRETFYSAVRAGKDALVALGTEPEFAEKVTRAFIRHDRYTLRRLADVWDPKRRPLDNPEYVSLARQLNTDVASAMEGLMDEDPDLPLEGMMERQANKRSDKPAA